jgi:hypothetical protein
MSNTVNRRQALVYSSCQIDRSLERRCALWVANLPDPIPHSSRDSLDHGLSASFDSDDNDAPSKPGIKHLAREPLNNPSNMAHWRH